MPHDKTPMKTTIFYRFNRASVANIDFTKFLTNWGPAGLPKETPLLHYLDGFDFAVAGYDQDPRELFVIPEVRAFYQEFKEKWPYWLFACNLDMPGLMTMTLCCLASVKLSQRQGGLPWHAEYSGKEMRAFLQQEFLKMENLCQRAGMTLPQIIHRRQRVLDYFGIHPALVTDLATESSPNNPSN